MRWPLEAVDQRAVERLADVDGRKSHLLDDRLEVRSPLAGTEARGRRAVATLPANALSGVFCSARRARTLAPVFHAWSCPMPCSPKRRYMD
jgi:hypothetical protein